MSWSNQNVVAVITTISIVLVLGCNVSYCISFQSFLYTLEYIWVCPSHWWCSLFIMAINWIVSRYHHGCRQIHIPASTTGFLAQVERTIVAIDVLGSYHQACAADWEQQMYNGPQRCERCLTLLRTRCRRGDGCCRVQVFHWNKPFSGHGFDRTADLPDCWVVSMSLWSPMMNCLWFILSISVQKLMIVFIQPIVWPTQWTGLVADPWRQLKSTEIGLVFFSVRCMITTWIRSAQYQPPLQNPKIDSSLL